MLLLSPQDSTTEPHGHNNYNTSAEQEGGDELSRTWSWLRSKFKKLICSSKCSQSPEGTCAQKQEKKGRNWSHSGPAPSSSVPSSEPSSGRPSTSSESSGGRGSSLSRGGGYGAAYARCGRGEECDGAGLSRDGSRGSGGLHIGFLAPRPSMRRSSCSSVLPQPLTDGAVPLLPAAMLLGCPVGPRLAKARSVQLLLRAGTQSPCRSSRRLSQVMPQRASGSSGGSSCGFEAMDSRSDSCVTPSGPPSARSSCSGLVPSHSLRYCDLVVALQHPSDGSCNSSETASGNSSKRVSLEESLQGTSVDNGRQSEGIGSNQGSCSNPGSNGASGSPFTTTNTRGAAAWGGHQLLQRQERSVCLRRTISYAQSRSSRLCSVSESVRPPGDAGQQVVVTRRAVASEPLPKIVH